MEALERNHGYCHGGCGEKIKRWTTKCVYDPVGDRAFCNKNGCADRFREAPSCAECGVKVLDGDEGHQIGRRDRFVCGSCFADIPKGQVPEGVGLVPPPDTLDRATLKAVEAGPYSVYRKLEHSSFFQVGKPIYGELMVQATAVDEDAAFERCAEANR